MRSLKERATCRGVFGSPCLTIPEINLAFNKQRFRESAKKAVADHVSDLCGL